MRRRGRALYGLGALLIVVALVIVIRSQADTGPKRRPYVPPKRSATTRPLSTTTTSATSALSSPAPRDANTPPRITAPDTATIARSRASAVPGISVADSESREGDTFGVLLYAPEGKVTLGTTQGLRLAGENGSGWIPMEGRIDAINGALATLRYAPNTPGGAHSLVIVATDNGHRNRYSPLATRREVHLSVSR